MTVPGSPPQTRSTPTSSTFTSAQPPRTNGSLHQPPPAEPDDAEQSYTRNRSGTETAKRSSIPPTMSASISGPQDFYEPSAYYSGTVDSPTSTTSSKAKFGTVGNTDSAQQSPVTSTPTSIDIEKKDSLSRARGIKKSSGSLQRQSLKSSSESAAQGTTPAPGVQLEDRPVDFD